MRLAVIPARGGSKRIPRKNIKLFDGKPIIAFAIDAAKQSGLFQHIVVSTDDEEISRIALELGAEIPFIRPPELADDFTPTTPVIAHAITACRGLGWEMDYVCCIYPTVPFIQAEDLKRSLDLLKKCKADYSFPVTEFPSAIQRAMRRLPDGQMQPFFPEYELTRTQDLEPAYYDAGQFYWGQTNSWLCHKKIHSNGVGFSMPSWKVADIDTPSDWERAEILHKALWRSDEH
jgi:pseudaminic acid cytidylyltransferase